MTPRIHIDFHIDVTAALAALDSVISTAYEGLRALGLSTEATKDALTVHVSDTLVACQAERDELPADEDDDTGGVRTR